MSKKKSSGSANAVRKEIQRLDRDLLKALSDRARAAQKLAKIRQNEELPLYDLTEEQEALAELLPQNKGPLERAAVRIDLSRGPRHGPHARQADPRGVSRTEIQLQPPGGDRPLRRRAGSDAGRHDQGGLRVDSLQPDRLRHRADRELAPTAGSSIRSICSPACRRGSPAKCSSPFITTCSASARAARVTEVYSKPQALSQCREWLAKNLPQAKQVEMTSTAIAAQIAADKPGAAAIASMEAGQHYGLAVIDSQHRRQQEQCDAVRRHRRRDAPSHRPRQDGPDVRDPAQAGLAGRRDARLQARPAEPDLDRIVPDARTRRTSTCSSSNSKDTRPTRA